MGELSSRTTAAGKRKMCSLTVALLLVCCGGCLAADPVLTIVSYSAGVIPVLGSDRTVELLAASTVVLNCRGERPISWSTPDVAPSGLLPQYRFSAGRAVQSAAVVPACAVSAPGNMCYSSNITLSGLSYSDVGRIECRYADGSTLEQAFVFLLVNDPAFVGCLPSPSGVILLIKLQQDLVIPCIAPSSRVTPSLVNAPAIRYVRQQGFVIQQAVPSKVDVRYMCRCSPSQMIYFAVRFDVQPEQPTIATLTGPGRSTFLVGERVEIECTDTIITSATLSLNWIYPSNQMLEDVVVPTSQPLTSSGRRTYGSILTFNSVALRHSGTYKCVATSASGNMTAFSDFTLGVVDKPFVSFANSGTLTVEADISFDSPLLVITFVAVPPPSTVWVFGEDDNRLSPGLMYTITNTTTGDNYTETLIVNDVQPERSGTYTLLVQAPGLTARRSITLLVNVPPTVVVEPPEPIYANFPLLDASFPVLGSSRNPNPQLTLRCKAAGVPAPVLSWMWQPCRQPPCSEKADAWAHLAAAETSPMETFRGQNSPRITLTADRESHVTITPRYSGLYLCRGTNKWNSSSRAVRLIVRNGESNLFLVDQQLQLQPPQQLWLAVGEVVNLTCYSNALMLGMPNFYRKQAGSNNNVQISDQDPCCAVTKSRTAHSNLVSIVFNATLSSPMLLGCEADDLNEVSKVESTSPIQINVSNVVLPRFVTGLPGGTVMLKAGSEARFSCVAVGFPRPQVTWLKDGKLLIGSPGGIFLSADGNMTIERAAGSDKGTYECIAASQFGRATSNMTLTISEVPPIITRLSDTNIAIIVVIIVVIIAASVIATVFLVRRFCRKKAIPHEFLLPSKNMLNPDIPLDEQTDCLPYDAEWEFPRDSLKFGMVLGQGAFGRVIKADAFGIEQGVTVTTVAVKSVRDPDDIEQIKALISELKILIHLGQHLNIVNLLGAVTRRLKRGELYVIVEYCRFGNLRSYLLKHKAHFVDVLDEESERSLAARLSTRRSVMASTSGGGGDTSDDYLNSSSRSQMHCEENPLTTLDLIYWSFQICRGMQYLASIQYIHRDLAARNVLLADDNIVKICDFGLAKDIYKYHEYRKKTDGPLPIKWMALESLTHKLFTTASDVWSFGVTLWELFTLAATPYPSIELNEAFLEKLQAGYRMEQPKHAPDNIYKIMLKCWHPEAGKRPTFADLSSELSGLLAEPVRDHYLMLEEPYTEKRDAREDYPPHYKGLAADSKDSDYLPVISSAQAAAAQPASGQPPSDYYNLGTSKTAAAEKGTPDEKLPLSMSMAHDDDADQDVFEGEDIPLPSCVAPLPNAKVVDRYTTMPQVSKEKGAAAVGPKAAARAAGVPAAAALKEDRQLLLSQRSEELPVQHLPAVAAASGRTGGTVETAI